MNSFLQTMAIAQEQWRSGCDDDARASLAIAEKETVASVDHALQYGVELLRMKQFWLAIEMLRASTSRFTADYRVPELLVDACFQVGDADGALDAYTMALSRGVPAQTEAIRRVTRVAIWCGQIERLEPLLDGASSAPFQMECCAMFENERRTFERLERLRISKIGVNSPTSGQIREATIAGDLTYAASLFLAAVRSSDITEQALLEVVHNAFPPSGHVAVILAFTAWRLLKRFPANPLSSLEVGIHGLLQFGDAFGARQMLERAMLETGAFDRQGDADRAVRLATSCSVFSAIPEHRVARITGELWHLLQKPDFAILANGFAARSVMKAKSTLSADLPRPLRIAVCVSGQLRNFRSSWPTTRAALASYDTTIFLSTWDTIGAGLGSGDSIARKLPAAVRDNLAGPLQTRQVFSERYPITFGLFDTSDQTSRDECERIFDTKSVRVHDEKAFDEALRETPGLFASGTTNQAKMYFGIHDALSMKNDFESEHGLKFDLVIRIRPDLDLRDLGKSDVMLAMNGNCVLSTHLRCSAIGDVFLIMPSKHSDYLCEMWPAMRRAGSFGIVPGATGAAAETALFETLCWNGVHVLQLRNSQAIALNSITISSDELWHTLRRDLAERAQLDEIDLTIASAVSKASGDGEIANLESLMEILLF